MNLNVMLRHTHAYRILSFLSTHYIIITNLVLSYTFHPGSSFTTSLHEITPTTYTTRYKLLPSLPLYLSISAFSIEMTNELIGVIGYRTQLFFNLLRKTFLNLSKSLDPQYLLSLHSRGVTLQCTQI